MYTIATTLVDDLRTGVTFLTRVPLRSPDAPDYRNFVRAHRVFPLVAAAIGAAIGLADLGLVAIGLPAGGAAALALGAGALLTGALHEDGLADVADGFGGGRDKPAKLEIMRDSRLGTYGALALLVAFAAKLSAFTALPQGAIVPALVAAHALARAAMTIVASALPNARADGLSAQAGRPPAATAAVAALVALVIAGIVLPWTQALGSALAAGAGALAVALLAQRQIGGQTGDVLGAAEQVAEIAVLLFLTAALR
ncbi:adenosylcobinamide-GDP ribazoletransferase [Bradyrhizobium sp.]|uniref:adenosylcobinamide-GDP ribazoletransferase n=1 Tax=Bradyrhizobium sp. TaxID=376 RepID=UPI002393A33B|nr:adenosylcobinamide-GDP ribazoletransferase [Bradyrhizobium sp.]MDE2378822.1 adenosylcobinamide-GDP ribazoletransferase [Bradyrhizobium sp.]